MASVSSHSHCETGLFTLPVRLKTQGQSEGYCCSTSFLSWIKDFTIVITNMLHGLVGIALFIHCGLKERRRREWASSSPGKSERRMIHLLEGYLSVFLSCQTALTPASSGIQFSSWKLWQIQPYKTLSGFSLPSLPAPSCVWRKAICIPLTSLPKAWQSCLAAAFLHAGSSCLGWDAVTRMWLMFVEKSEWAWRARGDAEQPARTMQGPDGAASGQGRKALGLWVSSQEHLGKY